MSLLDHDHQSDVRSFVYICHVQDEEEEEGGIKKDDESLEKGIYIYICSREEVQSDC